jgi:hypothetical protein
MPPVSVTSQARNFAPLAAVVVVDPPAAEVVVVVEELDPQAASAPAARRVTATLVTVFRRFRLRLIAALPLCVAT